MTEGEEILSAVVYSPDPATLESITRALEDHLRTPASVEGTGLLSRAVERVLASAPTMALFDLSGDPRGVLHAAAELKSARTRLVAVYQPLLLKGDMVLSELFLSAVRQGFFDFLKTPVSGTELDTLLSHLETSPPSKPVERGSIYAVTSAKGGVGKTAIAVNLACAIALRAPDQVALVDAAMDLGSMREFLSLEPERSFFDAYEKRASLDRDVLLGIMARHERTGVWLLDAPRRVQEMAAIDDRGTTQVLLSLAGAFRYVVVDTVAALGPLTLAVSDLAERLVVVTEALVPTLKGTAALLAVLDEAGYDPAKIRIVLNRFSRSDGHVEPHLAAQSLARDIDFLLPYDKRVLESANLGVPHVADHPQSTFSKGIDRMARDITGLPPAPPYEAILRRLFR